MFKNIKRFFSFSQPSYSYPRGFSLIELLVVISIIGILATVIGVNYNTAKKTARDAKRKTDMENVAAAFEMYYSEFKKYPACPYTTATITLNDTGYLITIPRDPKEDGVNWTYMCNSGDKWFGVYVRLEDTNSNNITLPGLTSHPQEDNIKQGSGEYHGDGSGYPLFYRVVGK